MYVNVHLISIPFPRSKATVLKATTYKQLPEIDINKTVLRA